MSEEVIARNFGDAIREGLARDGVAINHPSDCFIIRNPEDTGSLRFDDSLAVFSSGDAAAERIQRDDLGGALVRHYSWDELVEVFGERYSGCAVDFQGEEKYYDWVPLQKGI